jgi:phage terminase large subunit-like protein
VKDFKTSTRFIIQQRLAEVDISGWLIQNFNSEFSLHCIPVTLTDKVSPPELALMYDAEGYFWHNKYDDQELSRIKNMLRTVYSGQFMQNPQPEQGSIIQRAWFEKVSVKQIEKYPIKWNLVLDTAFTSNHKNNPTGYLIVGMHNNILYVRKADRLWEKTYELVETIKRLKTDYNIQAIYIEKITSGLVIYDELRRQTNYNVIALNPMGKDKVARVNSVQPSLQAKRVVLVEDGFSDVWIEMALSEWAAFTGVADRYDDLTDCLSYACNQFLKTGTNNMMIIKTPNPYRL